MKTRTARIALTFAGGLVGGLLASWLAPMAIGWYFNPPVEMGFNCKAPIEWALSHFLIAQAVGIGLGMVITVVLQFALKKKDPVLT